MTQASGIHSTKPNAIVNFGISSQPVIFVTTPLLASISIVLFPM